MKTSILAATAIAGAFVLGGTTIAVAGDLITSSDIRNGSIRGIDVKNGSLTAKDFRGDLKGARGAAGSAGPAGPAGPRGVQGPKGGPDEIVRWHASFTTDGLPGFDRSTGQYRFVEESRYIVPKHTMVEVLDFNVTGPLTTDCSAYADLALQVLPASSYSDDNVGKWSSPSSAVHFGRWYTAFAGPLALVGSCFNGADSEVALPSFEADIVLALTRIEPTVTRVID